MGDKERKLTPAQIIYISVSLVTLPALILILSGDWLWIEGWIFDLWYAVLGVSAVVYLYRNDPALLVERLRKPGSGNQKKWDKYFTYVLLTVFMAWILVIPLDAKRYGWTGGLPLWVKVLGGALLLPSFFLSYRSYSDNPFASPFVRIQKERQQRVISTGVYGFVRHPMYLGGALMFIGAPLLLGSIYGLVIGSVVSLLLALRIIGEERMLVQELEGYNDYKEKVRYRLIPFVW